MNVLKTVLSHLKGFKIGLFRDIQQIYWDIKTFFWGFYVIFVQRPSLFQSNDHKEGPIKMQNNLTYYTIYQYFKVKHWKHWAKKDSDTKFIPWRPICLDFETFSQLYSMIQIRVTSFDIPCLVGENTILLSVFFQFLAGCLSSLRLSHLTCWIIWTNYSRRLDI